LVLFVKPKKNILCPTFSIWGWNKKNCDK
jgi:hypothetical protein